MNERTLYKRSKTGKDLLWTLCWDDKSYWTISGEIDGKLTTSSPTFCESKNVGRANETSIEQQVLNEVESKIKYQLEHGYYNTLEEIPNEKFEVSLAAKYHDRLEKGKEEFPYICQPKLDGIRCYIQRDPDGVIRLRSRAHKLFLSVPHLAEDPVVRFLLDKFPGIVLDGELYNHDLKKDFNKIVSLVRKTKPTDDDLLESKVMILFNCFDCYLPNEPDMIYSVRNQMILDAVKSEVSRDVLQNTSVCFVTSDNLIIGRNNPELWYSDNENFVFLRNDAEVESKILEYINSGFEGIMLKRDVSYTFGRSTDLLKYKKFKDEEYEIVGFEDGRGGKAGMAVIVVCAYDGGTFKAGVNGTEDYTRMLFNSQSDYIGKKCTIRYQELTPIKDDGTGGVPRFGKMVAIRDYE